MGSRFSASYVCLSFTSESFLSVWSLSTAKVVGGNMTMSLSSFSRFNALNSSFVKLQSVIEADCRVEAILLLDGTDQTGHSIQYRRLVRV